MLMPVILSMLKPMELQHVQLLLATERILTVVAAMSLALHVTAKAALLIQGING
jgi:hypothetical protein